MSMGKSQYQRLYILRNPKYLDSLYKLRLYPIHDIGFLLAINYVSDEILSLKIIIYGTYYCQE